MIGIFNWALFIYALLQLGCQNNTASKLIPFTVGDNQFAYINGKGKTPFETKFSIAQCFSEGLAIASPLGEHPGIGFINGKGVFVIPPVYSDATPFNECIAIVYADNTSIQAIDKTGKVLFSLPDANVAGSFSEGLAPFAVLSGNYLKWGFVDKTGKIVIAA